MKHISLALPTLLLLAACGAETPRLRTPAAIVPLPGSVFPSPGQLIGRDAGQLIGLFGQPALDITEGPARKLQFATEGCVLDTYLYSKGNSAPVVTYIDARQPDGTPADRGACISALGKRPKR